MQKSSVLDTEQEPQTHASQLLEVVLCSVYIVFVVKRIQKTKSHMHRFCLEEYLENKVLDYFWTFCMVTG